MLLFLYYIFNTYCTRDQFQFVSRKRSSIPHFIEDHLNENLICDKVCMCGYSNPY